jgi:hypothetical protein
MSNAHRITAQNVKVFFMFTCNRCGRTENSPFAYGIEYVSMPCTGELIDLLEMVAPASRNMPMGWGREADGVTPRYYCAQCAKKHKE